MGIFDSVKSTFNSLTNPDTWKSAGSKALDYGSSALDFVSPFAGAVTDLGLGIWNNHQQYKQAQGLNKLQFGLNKQYNEWLIPYQLGQEYQFASRYAKNSPKWNVTGLRKAGLNPILAVNGGFSGGNAPHASPGSVGSGGSTNPSLRMDILSAINAHKQNQLLDEQIEGEKIRNNNEKKNMGLSGRDATYARIFNEVKSLIGEDNFGKLSKSTLDSIKSLFDSPDEYSSLFGVKLPLNRPSSIPDDPIVSEDTPPSMKVYTQSRPKPYYDSRSRPRAKSIAERALINENLLKREASKLRRNSKKVFYFNEEFDKIPNWRKHLYR